MDDDENFCMKFLEGKCEEYLQHLITIGTKLAKDGKFNEEKFSKIFLPKKNFVLRKIREQQVKESSSSSSSKNCIDSDLIREIRAICKSFEHNLCASKNTAKDDDESPESFKTATNCESSNETSKKARDLKNQKTENYPSTSKRECEEQHHFLTQELNYGEMSKIFVQKSRIDTITSQVDKPDFDDLLETIYIYRARPCQ